MIGEGSSTEATRGITAVAVVIITGCTDHLGAVADMAVTATMIVAIHRIIVIIHLTLAADGSIEEVFLRLTLTMGMVLDDGSPGHRRRIVAALLRRLLTLTTVGITALTDRITLKTGWVDLHHHPLIITITLTPHLQ